MRNIVEFEFLNKLLFFPQLVITLKNILSRILDNGLNIGTLNVKWFDSAIWVDGSLGKLQNGWKGELKMKFETSVDFYRF